MLAWPWASACGWARGLAGETPACGTAPHYLSIQQHSLSATPKTVIWPSQSCRHVSMWWGYHRHSAAAWLAVAMLQSTIPLRVLAASDVASPRCPSARSARFSVGLLLLDGASGPVCTWEDFEEAPACCRLYSGELEAVQGEWHAFKYAVRQLPQGARRWGTD
jgi:hypothetical protein